LYLLQVEEMEESEVAERRVGWDMVSFGLGS
jgi:hypothetical protein